MTGQDMTVREDSLDPAAVQARIQYAKALAASNLLPDAYRGQPANVMIAVEYGQALGIRPIAAINGINVIKGKPTMSADLMASVVRQAGHRLRVEQRGMSVKATLIRADDPNFTFEVVWDEARARRAGLWGTKGPWTQYPEQMLRSRAITEVCRQGASDCLYGAIYSPEELSHTDNSAQAPGGGQYEGPDDTVARLRQECADIVHRYVARYGGDPEQIAHAYQADGGVADPATLTEWLMAHTPPQQPADTDGATQPEVVDGEIIEEDQHDEHQQ